MKISGKVIKEQRIKRGISQVDMAKAADMSRSAYIAFENNTSETAPLSLKSAVVIAAKLEKSVYELFEIDIPDINTSAADDLVKTIEQKDILIKELQNEINAKNNELIEEIAFLYNYVDSLFNQLIKLAENENDKKRDAAVKDLLQTYIFSTTGKVPNSFNTFKRLNDHWKHINEIENFDLNEYVNQ